MIIFPHQLKKQVKEIKNTHFHLSISNLNGNILEIGVGKGENLKYYNDKCSVIAIDKKLNDNHIGNIRRETTCKLNTFRTKIEDLQLEDASFDYIVGSFVLCSVESLESDIEILNKLLRNGGKIILLEHIKSENPISRLVQKILTGIFSLFALDCHMDRDPREILFMSGFKATKEKVFPNAIEPYLFIEAVKY